MWNAESQANDSNTLEEKQSSHNVMGNSVYYENPVIAFLSGDIFPWDQTSTGYISFGSIQEFVRNVSNRLKEIENRSSDILVFTDTLWMWMHGFFFVFNLFKL